MKNFLSNGLRIYRAYRSFAKQNKTYKAINYSVLVIAGVYLVLLLFPQILFAHQVSHKNFQVYGRQPLGEDIIRVLNTADARLRTSPIYDPNMTERVFISDSFGLYKLMTIKGNSMGSTIPFIGHSWINKSDIANDLVFRDSPPPNQRSLSGVIAHETMHNQIIAYLGPRKYLSLPRWKDEGYCEYIAGETTLKFEEGLKLWSARPDDPTGYTYFKYHQMIKYLLDKEGLTVEELFSREFDEAEIARKAFEMINKGQ